jgi:hypothetical protein
VKEKPVSYASIAMVRFLFGLPPENTEDTYLTRLVGKLEEFDPGAEVSHKMAQTYICRNSLTKR